MAIEDDKTAEFRGVMRGWCRSRDSSVRERLWGRLTALAEGGADPFKVKGSHAASCAFEEAVVSGDTLAIKLAAKAAEAAGISVRDGLNQTDCVNGEQGRRPKSILEQVWLFDREEGAADRIRLLIELGADPEGLAGSPGFPLMLMVAVGSVECAAALIEAGADVKRVQEGGGTLLHLALRRHEDASRMWRLLVAAGADPRATNENGDTPFERANSRQWAWIKALLESEELREQIESGGQSQRVSLRV